MVEIVAAAFAHDSGELVRQSGEAGQFRACGEEFIEVDAPLFG
ncbi:hypothetical protein [Nocardia abscessus]|nr:hypothetical protein [Nocardia abscessus]